MLDYRLRYKSVYPSLFVPCHQRSKIFKNALNLEQNVNQNSFYSSMPHIKTLACKNYACLETSHVVTQPIGYLGGKAYLLLSPKI